MNSCVVILFAVFTAVESVTLMPAAWIVANPAAQADTNLGISLLYCNWTPQYGFSGCYDTTSGPSYGGNANFDPNAATVSNGNKLSIPFETPYLGDPVCLFEFADSASHPYFHSLNSEEGKVHIYLYDLQKTSGSSSSIRTGATSHPISL